jgi:hypothetical protein
MELYTGPRQDLQLKGTVYRLCNCADGDSEPVSGKGELLTCAIMFAEDGSVAIEGKALVLIPLSTK